MANGHVITLAGGLDSDFQRDVWGSNDGGATWQSINPHAPWAARRNHDTVALSNGDVLLLGGEDGRRSYKNDVWRSSDGGVAWSQVIANAPWDARSGHSAVTTSNGWVLVLGGWNGTNNKNDVWGSVDGGGTWHTITAIAQWEARARHSSVLLLNGSVLIIGGQVGGDSFKNDVWCSSDGGTTWHEVVANAPWHARASHTSILVNQEVLVLGGSKNFVTKSSADMLNDVWRSGDGGATWHSVTATAQWEARSYHSASVLSTRDVILLGGWTGSTFKNDVWRSSDGGVTWHTTTLGNPARGACANCNEPLVSKRDALVDEEDWSTAGNINVLHGSNAVTRGMASSSVRLDSRITTAESGPATDNPYLQDPIQSSPRVSSNPPGEKLANQPCSSVERQLASPEVAPGTCVKGLAWRQINTTPVRNSFNVLAVSLKNDLVLELRFPVTATSVVLIFLERGMLGGRSIDTAWTQLIHHTYPEANVPMGLVNAAGTGMATGRQGAGLLLCGGQFASISGGMDTLSRCWWMNMSVTIQTCDSCRWQPRHSMCLASWPKLAVSPESVNYFTDLAFLFGGRSAGDEYLSDLWMSATAARSWVQVITPPTIPKLRGPAFAVVQYPFPTWACGAHEAGLRGIIAGGMPPYSRVVEKTSNVTILDICVSLLNGTASVANVTIRESTSLFSPASQGALNVFDAVVVALPDGSACTVGGRRSFDSARGAGSGSLSCTADGESWHALTANSISDRLPTGTGFGAAFIPGLYGVFVIAGTATYSHLSRFEAIVDVQPWIGNPTFVSISAHRNPVFVQAIWVTCAFRPSIELARQHENASRSRVDMQLPGVEGLTQCPRGAVRACVTLLQLATTSAKGNASTDTITCSVPTAIQVRFTVWARILQLGQPASVQLGAPHQDLCDRPVTIGILWISASSMLELAPTAAAHTLHDRVHLDDMCAPFQLEVPKELDLTSSYVIRMVVSAAWPGTSPFILATLDHPVPKNLSCPTGQVMDRHLKCRPPCPIGFFRSVAAGECEQCPTTKTTILSGRDNDGKSSCGCQTGLVTLQADCGPCPKYLDCAKFNHSASQLPTRSGWWRSPDNLDGKGDQCLASLAACKGGVINVTRCDEVGGEPCGCESGHQGPLCMSCHRGFARAAWIPPGAKPCIQCSSGTRAFAAVFLIIILSLVVCFSWASLSGRAAFVTWTAMSHYSKYRAVRARQRQLHQSLLGPGLPIEARGPSLPGKGRTQLVWVIRHRKELLLWLRSSLLLVQTVQIGLQYSFVAGAGQLVENAPKPLLLLLQKFVGSMLLDVQAVAVTGCLLPILTSPLGRLLVGTVPPALFSLLAAVVGGCSRSHELKTVALWSASLVMTLTASNAQYKIFSSLACRTLESLQDKMFLLEDPSIKCSITDSEFVTLIVVALLMAAWHCFGYVLIFYVALKRAALKTTTPSWLRPALSGMKPHMCILELTLPVQRMMSTACFVFLTLDGAQPSALGPCMVALLHQVVQFALISLAPFTTQRAQRVFLVTQSTVTLCSMQLAALPSLRTSQYVFTPLAIYIVLGLGVVLLGVVVLISPKQQSKTRGRESMTELGKVEPRRVFGLGAGT